MTENRNYVIFNEILGVFFNDLAYLSSAGASLTCTCGEVWVLCPFRRF